MSRARSLEEAQNWIGAAIDDSIGLAPQGLIIGYEVPLKLGSKIESHRALNWIWECHTIEYLADRLESVTLEIGDDPKRKSKVDATLSFIKYVINGGYDRPLKLRE